MGRLIRAVVALLLTPLAFSIVHEAYLFLRANSASLLMNWFIYGAAVYLLLRLINPGNKVRFLEIFEHEVGHAVIAFLFFRGVSEFVAKEEGDSHVLGRDSQGTKTFFLLAPYFLPVFTLPLLIIKPFIFPAVRNIIDFLIGFTTAFHFSALLQEFRFNQPDIQKSGLAFSLVTTVTLNLVFMVIILCVVLDNYQPLRAYLESSLTRATGTYDSILQQARRRF